MRHDMRKWVSRSLAVMMAFQAGFSSFPTASHAAGNGISLIRDAEIEELMRDYARPIFRVANIKESAVNVYLINDPGINAFVAGGQRIFLNTGLLVRAKTPSEVIGVIAHETGHIAGGHLARMGKAMDQASTTAIIGMLLGAAAIVGGAAAGQGGAAEAGQGIIAGSQQMAQRNFLAYARAQESAADQAAISYLNAAKMSGKGMLDLFQVLANQSIGSLQNTNRYVMTHPMPFDRIRTLEQQVKKSPYFAQRDSAEFVLRHQLMQAKLVGFMESPQQVYRKYPPSDNSLPGRYARAIAAYRVGDIQNALPLINGLIETQPRNPYFWELKGQALLETGRPAEAISPLQQATEIKPDAGLIQILLAQALLGTDNKNFAQSALRVLQQAERHEGSNSQLWRLTAQAYGKLGDIPRAELATAQAALLSGDRDLATQKAKAVLKKFNRGSPEWLRANDILNFASKKKG